MIFQVPVHIPELSAAPEEPTIREDQISIMGQPDTVSSEGITVSKPDIRIMIQKAAQILAAQGVSCCECPKSHYKLYPLSDCEGNIFKFFLWIGCPDKPTHYHFELTCVPSITI